MGLTQEEKRARAEQRQAQYDRLSDEEKLQRALTYGHEGTKEVQRLRRKIELKGQIDAKKKGKMKNAA